MEITRVWHIYYMDIVYDKDCRGSEVPLRALWCKARSGGGRLQKATARVEKEKKHEKIYT